MYSSFYLISMFQKSVRPWYNILLRSLIGFLLSDPDMNHDTFQCIYCPLMYSTFLECISHLCLRHAGQTLKFKRGHLDHVQGLRRFSIVDFDIKPEDATAAGNILVPVESEEAVYVACTLAAVPNEPKPNDVDSDVEINRRKKEVGMSSRLLKNVGMSRLIQKPVVWITTNRKGTTLYRRPQGWHQFSKKVVTSRPSLVYWTCSTKGHSH